MLSNFAFAAAVAVFFLLVGWRWSASQGIASRAIARRLLFYGINLVLGELYLVYLFAGQKWPRLYCLLRLCPGECCSGVVWYRAHGRRGRAGALGK